MGKPINANDLSKEITRNIKEYFEEIKINSREAAEEVAKDTVAELKATSPERSGRYKRNWTETGYESGAIVHQKAPTYRLTHLLEKGWHKRSGGRVAPQPHIGNAEEKAVNKYEEKLIEGI